MIDLFTIPKLLAKAQNEKMEKIWVAAGNYSLLHIIVSLYSTPYIP